MARQLMSTKKRGRPATGIGKPVHVRMHDDDLTPLDRWILDQPRPVTRSEAIRTIVREYLTGVGYIEPEPDEGEE